MNFDENSAKILLELSPKSKVSQKRDSLDNNGLVKITKKLSTTFQLIVEPTDPSFAYSSKEVITNNDDEEPKPVAVLPQDIQQIQAFAIN